MIFQNMFRPALFLDDSAVYRAIKSREDHEILQRDIKSLEQWEADWSMSFHPEKCQLLRITKQRKPSHYVYNIHGVLIDSVKEAKYLGVTIDNKLSWSPHIHAVCKKAHNTLNFLYRNFKTCPPSIKAKLYLAYVRPILEYCCSVWDPHTDANIKILEAVQRRAARFAFNIYSRYDRVTPLLLQLNWIPLRERRARVKVTLLYKTINNIVEIHTNYLTNPSDDSATDATAEEIHTRQFDQIFIPYARTNPYFFSYFISTIRLWNSLPTAMKSAQSLSSFQEGLGTRTLRKRYEL